VTWLAAGILVLIVGVLLEGRRQARKYGRPSGRPNLAGAGFLELQRHLQPDRKVEILQKQGRQDEAAESEPAGDPPDRDRK
jgi:hypothetical protein